MSEPMPGTAPGIFLPSTPKEYANARPPVEPSSPSPKCQIPLAPLTERDASCNLPDLDAASVTASHEVTVGPPVLSRGKAAASNVSAPCEVTIRPPALLPSEVAGITPTSPSEQVVIEPQPPSLPNPTDFPPMAAPSLLPQNLCDERFAYGEWMDQTRQVGGSYPPNAFHTSQPLFYPYHGNDGGMIALMQRGVIDRQWVVYPDARSYRDDLYRGDAQGDPRSPYGGIYTCAESSVMYPDARDLFLGIWPSPHPFCGLSCQLSVVPPDTQILGMRPSPHPAPGPSRHSSVNPPV